MIFDEQIARKPDHYPWAQDFISSMWKGHWTSNEFSFSSDVQDFKVNMSEAEKDVIVKTLSAIGQIEIAVKRFWAKLGEQLPHPSISDLGIVMASIEVIHGKAYEKLLGMLQLDDVFQQNLQLPVIKDRVIYLKKYTEKNFADSKQQYVYSLILFTIFIENISLFSQFYIINWFGRFRNVLKDTVQQTEYARQEESIHSQAGTKVLQTIYNEYPELFTQELKDKVIQQSYFAFECECKIVDWLIGDFEQPHLTAPILKEFIKNRINDSLAGIYFEPIFTVDQELIKQSIWFEEEVLGNASTDFFYKRPIGYQKKAHSFNSEDLF